MIDELAPFVRRLRKIGIELKMSCNYPWVYLEEVNGKPVKGKYCSNNQFTAFFYHINGDIRFSDKDIVFNKIRKIIN